MFDYSRLDLSGYNFSFLMERAHTQTRTLKRAHTQTRTLILEGSARKWQLSQERCGFKGDILCHQV